MNTETNLTGVKVYFYEITLSLALFEHHKQQSVNAGAVNPANVKRVLHVDVLPDIFDISQGKSASIFSPNYFNQVRYMWWCCLAFWVPCVSAWRLGVRIGERRPLCTYLVMGCCFTAFIALAIVLQSLKSVSWSMKVTEPQLTALVGVSLAIGVCILLSLIWAFYLQRRALLAKIVQHEDSVSTCIYTCFCWPCSYGQMNSFAEESFLNSQEMSRS